MLQKPTKKYTSDRIKIKTNPSTNSTFSSVEEIKGWWGDEINISTCLLPEWSSIKCNILILKQICSTQKPSWFNSTKASTRTYAKSRRISFVLKCASGRLVAIAFDNVWWVKNTWNIFRVPTGKTNNRISMQRRD